MPLTRNRCDVGRHSNLLNSLYTNDFVNQEPFQFSFRYDVSGGRLSHRMNFRFPETTVQQEDTEAMRMRVICHVLLDMMGDNALPEILETLKDNLEFYHNRPKPSSFSVIPDRVKFKLGQRQERPVFQLAEE